MNENLPATQSEAANPFGKMLAHTGGANAGSVEVESQRAIAEAQGQLVLAKKFPRSMAQATADLMDACKSEEFAKTAFYSVPNRGSGPSIRFAEEVARVYGNFQYGHRELGRVDGKSEIEVFAWDMEKNNRSNRQITVLHILDTKDGPRKLKDQADIDNRIANIASKQMRGRILALVPKHLVAMGIAECKKTLAGNNDEPISARVNRMTASFARFGVNTAHLAAYIGHSLDAVTIDELTDLIGVYNAIKDGAKASDYFKLEAAAATGDAAASSGAAKAITDQVKKAIDQEKAAAKTSEQSAAANARKDSAHAKGGKTAEVKGNAAKEDAPAKSEKGQETNKPSTQSIKHPEGGQSEELSEQPDGPGPDDDIF